MRSPRFVLILIFTILCFLNAGIGIGYMIWHNNNPDLAPTYALDCIMDTSRVGAPGICYPAGEFSVFWQEATKNTTFTIDGKPVEITDVQVFYKQTTNNSPWYHYTTTEDWLSFLRNHPNITWDANAWTGPDGNWIVYTEQEYTYGNITYYPSGIDNSQTYVAPRPTPTPCEWQTERTSYSFCGKVTVNSSAEFDRILKAIEKHSYHIQMGWMHLDYEYAHKTYDNTLPAPVNICMGIVPGDDFPIGSEWEGRMAYVIDECASLGSCDFDTLATIPTPTPTPSLCTFLMCEKGLGDCQLISGPCDFSDWDWTISIPTP
jgi:hypothetical protein